MQCPRYDLSVDYVNRLTFSEGLECGQHFLIEDCKGLLGAVTDMRRREYPRVFYEFVCVSRGLLCVNVGC